LLLGTELGGSWRVLPRALAGLAGLASAESDYVRAARLLGAAYSLWDASGKRDMPDWQAVFETDAATAREAMGDGPFSDAVAQGRAMRLEQVVAYALAHSGADSEAKGPGPTPC
jgi:hypothetical protein